MGGLTKPNYLLHLFLKILKENNSLNSIAYCIHQSWHLRKKKKKKKNGKWGLKLKNSKIKERNQEKKAFFVVNIKFFYTKLFLRP